MRKIPLIEKTIDDVVDDFFIPPNCTILVDGLLTDEVFTFNYIGMNGTDLTDVYDEDEVILNLSLTKPSFSVFTPLHIRISKPETTNPVGLYYIIM